MAVNTTLVQFSEDIASVFTSIASVFGSVVSIFLQPPFIYIIGVGIFTGLLGVAWRFMKSRRK